jgi:hypothetical protein
MEKLNEHDMTKKMMDIFKHGYKKLLNEEDNRTDTISPSPNDPVYKDEVNKFMDTVDPRVEVTKFKIYPNDRNVEFDGILLKTNDDNGGINFRMSFQAGKVMTSMSDIDLTGEINEILRKLNGYYENWVREWAKKLNTEYKPTSNE